MFASLLLRLRALIVASSISVFLVILSIANTHYEPCTVGWFRLVDISFWLLSLGSAVAGFLELLMFWKKSSLLSTILLTTIGTCIVVIARAYSAIHSLLETSFYTQLIGGSIIDEISYRSTCLALLGSFILLASTTLSTLYREPVVFRRGPSLYSSLNRIVEVLDAIGPKALYVISFAIGFAVRLYPELKYPGLPIGWDTLEYIATAKDFSYEPKLLTTYVWLGGWRNLPPLLTWVSGSLALMGLDPWIFFKAYPPIIVGLMSMISATIAYKVSGSKWVALASSLVTVFNPYILGQSQQWQRHVLGVVVLLAYLYLCEAKAKPRYRALALIVAALSYEPMAVIALVLSAVEGVASRGWRGRCIFSSSAILSLLLLFWYTGSLQKPMVALTPIGISVVGGMEYNLGSTLSYTITCSLLLMPSLVIILLRDRIDWRAKLAMAILFAAFILPALSVVAPVDQHRWFMALLTIATPYTVAGLAKLNRTLLILATLVVVVLGSSYPFTELGFLHFRIWPSVSTIYAVGYPWKMEPAITNVVDAENAAKVIEASKDVVLVRLGLYPWFHLYVRNLANVVITSQDPNLVGAVGCTISRDLPRLLVVTAVNMTKELEGFRARPEIYNETMLRWLGKEKFVSIDRIRCEALYEGTTLNVYVIEVVKG